MKKALISALHWIYRKRQILIQTLVLISVVSYFIYALGYTTNWAGIVTETRGASFFRASQTANHMMVDLGFFTIIVVLLNLAFGSIKRKKYYLSNFLLSIITVVLMIVKAVLTIYYNRVLHQMYAQLTEDEVPSYLYATHGAGAKSYAVFEQGTYLSYFILVVAVLLLVFTIHKALAQKERKKLIKELLINEH
ncbi:MAG: hypothetical protein WC992_03475 [Acholeplasmataceae bacterium]|nr:hypothetical protein [Acholeplasmataceae bacterium]